MPYTGTLGNYRGPRARGNAASMKAAWKLAKQAMKYKSDYEKAKAKTPAKPVRKTRADKGRKRKPRGGAKAPSINRNVTNGSHSYSKIAPRSYKSKEMWKKFPQMLSQTYYITSPESYTDLNPGVDGTITNPDMLYSVPSVLWTNSSIHMFNVHNTENHWLPTLGATGGVGASNDGYRTGTQLTNVPDDPERQLGTVSTFTNDSFIFTNDAINSKLISVRCPFRQNGLAENAVGAFAGGGSTYTTPNSCLKSLSIRLKVGNPTIQDEYITMKVIRINDGDTTLVPGTLGANNVQRVALTQTICNSGKFTNPQQFSTIYSTRFKMTGLRAGTKMKYYNINKELDLNYLRSNYRKQYNANNLTSIGLDAAPSYVISDDDSFFNGVFIVLQSNCIDNEYIATVSVETDSGNPEYTETGIPQIATYPPIGIPATELGGKYKPVSSGAQHCVSGTITVKHLVQSKRRAVGATTQESLNTLQEKIDKLECDCKKMKGFSNC